MNHQRRELVNEMERMISSARICMVSNTMLNWPLSHQSLKHQWFDPSGVLWFLFMKTDIGSPLFENGRMEVFYANAEKSMFMSLSGEATLVGREEIPSNESFPFVRTLENDALGPAFGVVKFEPIDVYAWNDVAQNMIPIMLKGDAATVEG